MWLPIQAQVALISAITAALVTIAVDYFVKPRLEVRKDRIVSLAKAKQELRAGLPRIEDDFHQFASRKTDNNLTRTLVNVTHCKDMAELLATQRWRRNRIHQVVASLSSSQRQLEYLREETRKPYGDEAIQQAAQDAFFAVSRFRFRRRRRVEGWTVVLMIHLDRSVTQGRTLG